MKSKQTTISLLIANFIIALWIVSTYSSLHLNLEELNKIGILVIVFWQTFLYTGLFITAHDAMHGVIFPQNLKINNLIGSIALIFYGFFPFAKMQKRHGQHHQYPATELDPDYHDGKHQNFLIWYLYFMFRYWDWLRFAVLVTTFHSIKAIFHIPEPNLLLFWIIPFVLSSFQLFYFGTFLPHHKPATGYPDQLRTHSIYLPFILSLITCYHFLYHREHHENPDVPWWGLPQVAMKNQD